MNVFSPGICGFCGLVVEVVREKQSFVRAQLCQDPLLQDRTMGFATSPATGSHSKNPIHYAHPGAAQLTCLHPPHFLSYVSCCRGPTNVSFSSVPVGDHKNKMIGG